MTRHALWLALVGLGCNSAHSGTTANLPEASAAQAFEVLRAAPALRGAVEGARPFARVGDRFFGPKGAPLAVELAATSEGAMRLADAASPEAWIEIVPRDVASVPASSGDRGLAFVGALHDGDITVLASPLFVEEARILHTSAPHLARYRLRLGPAIASVRSRERRIECLDEHGKVLLGTGPVFAVDAHGTRVELTPHVVMDDRTADVEIALDAPGLAAPIVIDPVWSTVSPMSTARAGGGFAVLADGKVLVAGGFDASSTDLKSAEVYDPALNTWTTVGSMANTHNYAQLVRLGSGRVLTADIQPEVYDPTAKTWSPAGASTASWTGKIGFLAKTGKAITFFHYGDSPSAMAHTRIYDEGADSWSAGASLPIPRGGTSAAMLADGRVLFVGGYDSNKGLGYSNADLYDPATDTWSSTTARPVRAAYAGIAVLPSGKVLVGGGNIPLAGGNSTAQLFDPTSATWTSVAPVLSANPTFVTVGAGRALAIPPAIVPAPPTLVFDEAGGAFQASAAAPIPSALVIPLGSGRVLLAGGQLSSGTIVATTAIWQSAALGAACTSELAGDCGSLFCADGVCCDKACNGPCEQCAVSGSAGTCKAMTGAPHVGRSCAPYASCSAGACVASCTADSDCASGSYCAGTTCVPKKAAGASCAAARECAAAGGCIDGVCCGTACGGQCEACDVPGYEGTCTPVVGAPRGTRAACTDFTKECGQVCDGKTTATCVYLPTGKRPCGKNACTAGTETHASTCNDTGACSDVPKSCGNYACGTASCLTACATKAECAAGKVCVLGACVPAPGLGESCKTNAECSTEFCTDGVCCGLPSCGAGATCAAPGKAGACTKLAGVACVGKDECASGKCVDGVCCDTDCSGQCEACNVPGLAGKCSPAKGKPRGARTACAAGTGPCDARACDGKEATSCAAFAGLDVSCREPSCKDGSATAPASCDGAGVCPAVATKSCGGYACDTEGVACRETCTSDEHCLADFRCKAGVCRPATATCSVDFTSRIGVDGVSNSCAPFLCRAGECPTTCGSSSDCVTGTACANGACVAAEAPSDEGGCGYAPRTRGAAGFLSVFALWLLFVMRRRSPVLLLGVALGLSGCSPREEHRVEVTRASQPITLGGATSFAYRSPNGVGIAGGSVLLVDVANTHRERLLSTGLWKDVTVPRYFGAITSIGSGQAMVFSAADTTAGAEVMAAELFDPATDTWPLKATPPRVHLFAWAARAGTTKVLLGNGRSSSLTASCTAAVDRYDTVTNTWAAAAPTSEPRCGAAVVTLSSGKVLVASGADTAGFTSTAELYDPVANTWSAAGVLGGGIQYPRGVPLPGDKALVVGNSVFLYEPTSNTWSVVSSRVRSQPGLALLPSGRVLFAGGTGDDAIEVFDPVTSTFLPAGKSAFVRKETSAFATTDGRVVIVGGTMEGVGSILEAEIFTEQANGAACVADGECTSAHCVDGRCCDKACNGACEACNLAGKLGTCSPVTGTPTPGHPSCAPSASCVAGACKTSCTTDSECCTTRDACCKNNTCATSFVGAFCDGSSCLATRSKGAACTRDAECATGFCTDGVCCASACKGQCEACGESAAKGDCVAVTGAPRGTRTTCTGGACGLQCDGVSRNLCTYPKPTVGCGSNDCASGVETHASFCDGVGKCNDIPKTCGAFACSGSTCATTCTTNSECAAGFYCKAGACLPTPGLGQPCSSTAPCLGTLSCTEGVCCGEASCATGKSCALPASKGTCAKIDGQTCASDGECGSRACVDGVCCESRCAGQCQACDAVGSVGKCVAITGAPHGSRLACAAPAGSLCEASTCDGSDGARCVGLAGSDVKCREPSCAKGQAVAAGSCNGAGACTALVRTACAPYRCATDACATSCSTNEECADGFVCKASACVKAERRCSDDGTAVLDAEGKSAPCAPFLCREGACIEACTTSTECAPGTACDGSGRCVPPTVTTVADDGGGGCAVSPSASIARPTSPHALVVLAALLAARRRRSGIRAPLR